LGRGDRGLFLRNVARLQRTLSGVLHFHRALKGSGAPFETLYFGFECAANLPFWLKMYAQIRGEQSFQDPALGWMNSKCGVLIYALLRWKKPEIVVETGVGALI
jgi:hypothetical protein